MTEGASPYRSPALAWAALLVLALVSFGLARLSLGAAGAPVAIGIGALKAAIIALVFMRLSGGRASSRLALSLAVVWISLLAAGVAGDVLTRDADVPRPPLDSSR